MTARNSFSLLCTAIRRQLVFGSLAMFVATTFLLPATAAADQTVPLVAHIKGKLGSLFVSDAKFFNPYSYPLVITLRITPEGQSFSTFEPGSDYTIQPGETLGIEDVYRAVLGEVFGKGRLDIEVNDIDGHPAANPITRISIANVGSSLGGEYQQYMHAVTSEDFHPEGTSLADTTVKGATERYNFSVTTGNDLTQIQYVYRNSAAGNARIAIRDYPANTTVHHVDPQHLFDLDYFEANSSLTAFIVSGSAVLFGTPGDLTTSDFRVEPWDIYEESDDRTVAVQYVLRWFPPVYSSTFLNPLELQIMIRGGLGVEALASELAEILHDEHPDTFPTAADAQSWLEERTNGDSVTDAEFENAFDSFELRPFPSAISFSMKGGESANFRLSVEALDEVYYLIRGVDEGGIENGGFLVGFVRNNPDLYGGGASGVPDLSYDPTWSTQDSH